MVDAGVGPQSTRAIAIGSEIHLWPGSSGLRDVVSSLLLSFLDRALYVDPGYSKRDRESWPAFPGRAALGPDGTASECRPSRRDRIFDARLCRFPGGDLQSGRGRLPRPTVASVSSVGGGLSDSLVRVAVVDVSAHGDAGNDDERLAFIDDDELPYKRGKSFGWAFDCALSWRKRNQ